MAYLSLVAQKVAKQPQETHFYSECIVAALGRIEGKGNFNTAYPASLKRADTEMTWCYAVHCTSYVVQNEGHTPGQRIFCD